MRMTKRNLMLTVWVLVIMNLAAALWLVTGLVNRDGKFRFFESDSVQLADTVVDLSTPDRFTMITNYAYHVSDRPNGERYTCITFVRAKWPESVNGDTGVGELKSAILAKMFGTPYTDIKVALDTVLAHPQFNVPVASFRRVDERPVSIGDLGAEHYYRCFPFAAGDRLLEYKVVRNDFDGRHATHRAGFVHYDRLRRQVITPDMVFDLNAQDKITALINERIAYFVEHDHLSLTPAHTIPQEFYIGGSAIIFVYPEGAIAPPEDGVIEIKVTYDRLNPYLSTYYKNLLNANDHFKQLPDLPL